MATTDGQSPKGQSPKQMERKAAAKEDIVNATSGAREIVDHAAFNARAVGKMLLHPFSKDTKADAIAKAREDKTASGQKMAAIRQVGTQQANALRSSARGMGVDSGRTESPESPGSTPDTDATDAASPGSGPATDARTATETAAVPVPGDHDRV